MICMKRERIGSKIKKLRKSHNLTQKELAETLGYSDKSMITHIEKGDSDMTYEKILLLLRQYSLDANELFDVNRIDELLVKYHKKRKKELLKKLFFNSSVNYIKYAREIDFKNLLSNEQVYFKPVIDDEDLYYCCCDYQLYEEQKEMVNPPYVSISRAYTNPNKYYPFIIRDKNDNNIGFISLNKWIGNDDSFSFSFLIDKRYQKRGYGISSIKLAIDTFKAIDPKKQIKIAVEQDNKKVQELYLSLGFQQLDELDGDDLVLAL